APVARFRRRSAGRAPAGPLLRDPLPRRTALAVDCPGASPARLARPGLAPHRPAPAPRARDHPTDRRADRRGADRADRRSHPARRRARGLLGRPLSGRPPAARPPLRHGPLHRSALAPGWLPGTARETMIRGRHGTPLVLDRSLSDLAYRCWPDGCPRDRTCCVGLIVEVSRREVR